MKPSSKTGKKVKKTIPWSLHMAIVRLKGTEELEYEDACAHAAVLIEEGGERFKEEVKVCARTGCFMQISSTVLRYFSFKAVICARAHG